MSYTWSYASVMYMTNKLSWREKEAQYIHIKQMIHKVFISWHFQQLHCMQKNGAEKNVLIFEYHFSFGDFAFRNNFSHFSSSSSRYCKRILVIEILFLSKMFSFHLFPWPSFYTNSNIDSHNSQCSTNIELCCRRWKLLKGCISFVNGTHNTDLQGNR